MIRDGIHLEKGCISGIQGASTVDIFSSGDDACCNLKVSGLAFRPGPHISLAAYRRLCVDCGVITCSTISRESLI
jgi:hypothetical protein